ncbi:hepatitis A virus cellular receptor 1 homolog isoform X2 [Polyodon spathula]|uniref:hepatitis A virus cellular receptor 1 homolog isoform X2 n=1 Tax=Polyodon spathula TaxID=7913 RepID=UPI001B7DAAB4|nr:hepatitis A virus cellular receptor 1 homolog isoform X2 [Polyodon spathula]
MKMALSSVVWVNWIPVITACVALVNGHEVLEGHSVTLPCSYSVRRNGLSAVCWGKGCGTMWCSDEIIQTDGKRVTSKLSERYRLNGNILDGNVALTILNTVKADSGSYCCRIDIAGYFNDRKVSLTLKVIKAPALTTALPNPLPPIVGTENHNISEPHSSTSAWSGGNSSQFSEIPKRNSSLLQTGDIEESALKSDSFSVPVAALCVSVIVLLLIIALAILLVFKRKLLKGAQKNIGSTRPTLTLEPEHIIYQMQTGRQVEENIYSLD